jgi:UDP-2,3-diacylglucosamine hydrolase
LKKNKIFFASDFHLGALAIDNNREREAKIVRWLEEIKETASELYLVGDVFDYWFEYKHVVPKGFLRLFGALASLSDSGTKISYFTGNHDMWVFDYFEKELGIKIYYQPILMKKFGKKLYVGHGDGLGPGDKMYKFIKAVFANTACQTLFSWIHPDIGIGLMKWMSMRSRLANPSPHNEDNMKQEERLITFCEEYLNQQYVDYFIFGHRHLSIKHLLSNNQTIYFNLGEWWDACSYLVMDEEGIDLCFYH